ncbi:glycosyltransferase [Amycolatopsis sp. CA-230715]|uniref:glycosyltransferase n=1 Tax=Amycolatopsis sp. CA-230715 TaxID=2745196 RepID=UPI001C01ED94|nr:glycosyltransferase [Amycolatopsis sp. CA-230715]QWF83898.1 4'-demethylrebeccamycin synthase [Amycolatopsis sp. CA-230715]
MARLLFVSWYGAGNQGPAIAVARAMAERGHEIVFAGYANQRELFEGKGFEFRLLVRADAGYPKRTPPEGWLPSLVAAVWACPAHLEDLPAVLAGGSCDAIVVDCLMFGALAAAEASGLPVAVLVHSAPGALAAPGDPLEHAMLDAVNEVRQRAGLDAVARLWDAWTPLTTVCTSIPEMDPMADSAPESFRYVGPLRETGARETPPFDDPRPVVLAGFSTGPAWDQTSRVQRTLDALADEDVLLLATLAEVKMKALSVPENATVVPYLQHDSVLPHASAMVTHAGHGTVCAALAHGVPVVCLPNPGSDQHALAAHVSALGAGIALDGDAASPAEIREAVAEVVGSPAYATAARSLAARFAAAPGAAGAVAELERLVAHCPKATESPA